MYNFLHPKNELFYTYADKKADWDFGRRFEDILTPDDRESLQTTFEYPKYVILV